MRNLFRRWVLAKAWLAFVVMSLSFLLFGAGTLNLIDLFQANARFIAEQGWQAVMDGAVLQMLELVLTGAVSMAAYVVFKTCEHRLSHWLGGDA